MSTKEAKKLNFETLNFEDLIKQKESIDTAIIKKAKEQGKGIDEERIKDLESRLKQIINDKYTSIEEELKAQAPKRTEIKINELPAIDTTQEHNEYKTLILSLYQGLNVLLVGEAGSGKTTSAERAAKALNLDFYAMSVGLQTGKHEFFGYMDANGNFVETDFYKAYKEGGVFLIDEIDAGHAGVLTSINSALANDAATFANGRVKKHKDFLIVATANTFGKGATAEYVGRNTLDAATIDRFTFIEWNIDEELERKISPDAEWCQEVQAIRHNAREKGIKIIVSTRAIFSGAKLLAAGISKNKVKKMVIFKGLNPEAVKMIDVK